MVDRGGFDTTVIANPLPRVAADPSPPPSHCCPKTTRHLLEAATSTTRETRATCTCPLSGKGFRQEISVPDHGARIRAIETLLREGLGRVGEAEIVEPHLPSTADEVKNLCWDDLNLVFALTHAMEIRAVVDNGDEALRSELESWGPKTRASLARVLAEVG